MEINNKYFVLSAEVEKFRDEILEKIKSNNKAQELYKGCIMLYSSLIENPPFLFIGINPGDGAFKYRGILKADNDLEPNDGFEYINAIDDGDFALARETRELFEKAGLYSYLEQSVKTNFYYFASDNAKQLWELFSTFDDETCQQFHSLAFKWTKQFIELIKPKVIICEGMTALKKVSELFDVDIIRDGSIGYFELEDKTLVFGYSRLYSNIKDKDHVSQMLKTKIQKN